MSSSGSQSLMSTGSRKRWRRSGWRKKWAMLIPIGGVAPTESRRCPPVNPITRRGQHLPQRYDVIVQQALKPLAFLSFVIISRYSYDAYRAMQCCPGGLSLPA
jgi:hypothetical protein